MIFTVHSLYFLFNYALKLYRRQKARRAIIENEELRLREDSAVKEDDLEQCLEFDPPVYRQRYSTVQQVLLDPRWRKDVKKIVDFGCAEMGFFQYMKHLFGVRDVLEVDLCPKVLEDNISRVQPLTSDWLKQRSEQLIVRIFCGSISDPDCNLLDVDAVVGIEIIEHLYPDTLDALPYNIFGYVNPRVAVFTTPNADFNVLFPNFKGFRHDDHKFEWTREQFQDWALNITARFPEYSVSFQGIGDGPRGTESLGCCSQMAVFVRNYKKVASEIPELATDHTTDISRSMESFGVCTYYSYTKQITALEDVSEPAAANCDKTPYNKFYRPVSVVEFPFVVDERSPEEKMRDEAMYIIHRNSQPYSRYFNRDTGIVQIPLYELTMNLEGPFATVEEIRTILEKENLTITECTDDYGERSLCVLYDVEMDNRSSSPQNTDGDQSEQHFEHNFNSSFDGESDWECDYSGKAIVPSEKVKKPADQNDSSPLSNAEPSEQLFDSGYQKSISNADWSPESPIDGTFEEQFSSVKIDINDIKDNVKANMLKELNLRQINNEVISSRKNAASSSKKSPLKEVLPGTSDTKKKRKSRKSDSEEDSLKEDVRHITDCILYNSLNRVDVADEEPEQEQILVPDGREQMVAALPERGYVAVENGDLANNNRDDEGNNYPYDLAAQNPQIADDNNDNENRDIADNNAEAAPIAIDQDQQNRNDIQNVNLESPVRAGPAVRLVDYDDDEPDVDDVGLNHASREALFDPDSQQDMLEEFEATQVDGHSDTDLAEVRSGASADDTVASEENDVAGVPDNMINVFPNWLLQLLGQSTEDEPHFYCQGDGLGVHPSIVIELEDNTSDSSSNDDAQAEQTLSDDDVGTLPVDSVNQPVNTLRIIGHSVPLRPSPSNGSSDSADVFFDTLEEGSPDKNPDVNKRK